MKVLLEKQTTAGFWLFDVILKIFHLKNASPLWRFQVLLFHRTRGREVTLSLKFFQILGWLSSSIFNESWQPFLAH